MTLNIDITDLKSKEIIKILSMYPMGHCEIKYERVFWCSDYAEPSFNNDTPGSAFDPRRPPQGKGNIGQAFNKMSDSLASLVQIPSRR
jgi:hypothetical protein